MSHNESEGGKAPGRTRRRAWRYIAIATAFVGLAAAVPAAYAADQFPDTPARTKGNCEVLIQVDGEPNNTSPTYSENSGLDQDWNVNDFIFNFSDEAVNTGSYLRIMCSLDSNKDWTGTNPRMILRLFDENGLVNLITQLEIPIEFRATTNAGLYNGYVAKAWSTSELAAAGLNDTINSVQVGFRNS